MSLWSDFDNEKDCTRPGYTMLGKCTCDCHRIANVWHCVPCCYPVPPKNYSEVSKDANPNIADEEYFQWILLDTIKRNNAQEVYGNKEKDDSGSIQKGEKQ